MSAISDLVDVEATVIHYTEEAVLLESHTTGKQAWVPLSVAEDGGDGTWAMPEAWAQDKELI